MNIVEIMNVLRNRVSLYQLYRLFDSVERDKQEIYQMRIHYETQIALMGEEL